MEYRQQQLLTIGVFSIIACAIIYVMSVAKEKFTGAPVEDKSVDGPKLHLFAENKCSPSCCDQSNFSCSTGCVCMSETQRMALSSRGNNARVRNYFEDF